MFHNPVIIGGGNWGTTMACILARNQQPSTLLVRDEALAEDIRSTGFNQKYLPSIALGPEIHVSTDLKDLQKADLLLLALPTSQIRHFLQNARPFLPDHLALVNLAKGLEAGTGLRISEFLSRDFPKGRIATLSGPNIAHEIASGKPATAVVASENSTFATEVQHFLSTPQFRLYSNTDLIGVEIAGALKNIIAIGAGICRGLDLGDNGIAALMTRGIAEISRYGCHFKANPLTFMGMAGIGDLAVTCMSHHSRNNTLGNLLAKGLDLSSAQAETRMTTEGVYTCQIVYNRSLAENIYMPITHSIYRVLFERLPPRIALEELMQGSLKGEDA